jgi:predicted dehydrogenase
MGNENTPVSRREFLKDTGRVTATGALAMAAMPSLAESIPAVHAPGSDLIQVAFVGCGGRGTGAAAQALSTKTGPIKIVAMADAFADRLQSSYDNLSKSEVGDKIDVPQERRFIGWDAYKKAMDCLKPGDVVILTTPPAFRWVHFTYAIQKGLNVFMEKPVTVDGPTSKRMLQLAEQASAKNLKVGVGLMSRHYKPLEELHDRIQNGELGEVILMRGYRMHGPGGYFESLPKPANISDLDYQVRRFHSFIWASGGNFSDFYIHHIDHLSWMKNAWPVKAQALGGRHYKTNDQGVPYVDQNFDTYSVEYTYPDGTKFYFDGRCMVGAQGIYSTYIHGTKGVAIGAAHNDYNGPAAIYKGQSIEPSKLVWQSTVDNNPYQTEWDLLISAIRNNKPWNEVKRGVEASVATSLGRMAAHTGQETTFEQMLNCPREYAPGLDKLTAETPAPLQPDAKGFYPKPQPGRLDPLMEY